MKFLSDILAKAGLVVDGVTQLNTVANATTDTDKFLVSDGGVVKYRTGAELASDIGPGNLSVSTVKHLVKLGEAAAKGQAVYVSSADGTNMIVSKASNASEATSSKTLGLLETGGILNDQVYVVTEGLLAGLDTSTAVAGDPVWLGTEGNIIFGLLNKPYAPAHLVFIGIVTRVQQNNGEIFVKVQNGFELKELHDVQITTTPADNTVLSYETSSSLYKMKSIPTLLGYTPASGTGVSGQVTYWTGTNAQAGSNNLFWDITNSRLGIGTTTPSQRLTIYGGNANGQIKVGFDDNANWEFGRDNSVTGDLIFTNNLAGIAYERLRIKQGTGNVGIGTSTPGFRLDVVSSSGYNVIVGRGASGSYFETYTIAGTRHASFGSEASGDVYLGSRSNNPLIFITNNTAVGRIDASGNLLFGSTSDAYIQGNRFVLSMTGVADTLISFKSSSTSLGYIYASTASIDINANSRPLTFSTTGSEKARIFNDGNFGIGTGSSNAGYKLDVNGTFRASGNATLTNAVITGGNTSLVTGVGLFNKSVIQIFDGGLAANNIDKIADLVLANNTSYLDGSIGRIIGVNTNPGLSEKRIAQIAFSIDGDTKAGLIAFATTNSSGVFSTKLIIRSTGSINLSSYGTGARTGTVAYNLAVDASGNLIETAGGVVDGSGTANYIPKWTDPNTLANSNIQDDGTKITLGISTYSSSDFRFGADYAGPNTGLIKWQGSGALIPNSLGIFTWGDAKDIQIGGANVYFTTEAGTQRMTLNSSGNLGLGVTPSVWGGTIKSLELPGGISFFALGSAPGDAYITQNATFNGANWIYKSTAASGVYRLLSGSHAWFNAPSGTAGGTVTFTQAMTLDASGRLGIGTTTPAYKLHVVTDAVAGRQNMDNISRTTGNWVRFTNPQYSTEASMGLMLRVFPDSDTRQGAGIIASGGANNACTDLDLFVTTSPDGLGGTSYSGLRINGLNGAVGIGTTAPNYLLHLQTTSTYLTHNLKVNAAAAAGNYAEIAFQLWSGATGGQNVFGGAGTSRPSVVLRALSEDANANGALVFATFGAGATNATLTEKMRLTSTGRLGIGTASPQTALDVSGSIRVSGTGGTGFFNGSNVIFESSIAWGNIGGSAFQIRNTTSLGLIFGAATSQLMTLTTGGNLGIGTSTPNEKLVLEGNSARIKIQTTSSPTVYYTYLESNYNAANTFNIVDGGSNKFGSRSLVTYNDTYINSYYNVYIATGTSLNDNAANIRLFVTQAGNIGIGNTAPTTKLHVSGGVQVGDSTVGQLSLRLTRTHATVPADAHYYVTAQNTPVQSWIEGGFMTGERAGTVTASNTGYPYYEEYAGQGSATAKTFGFINVNTGNFTGANIIGALVLKRTGQLAFPLYTSTSSFTGTAVAGLAVDSSGNLITTATGGVSGTGTANYMTKWLDADTITNSIVFDNGTNVGVGTAAPNYKLHVTGIVNADEGFVNGQATFHKSVSLGNIGAGVTYTLGQLNFGSVYTHHFTVRVSSYAGTKVFTFVGYQAGMSKLVSGTPYQQSRFDALDVIIESVTNVGGEFTGVKIGIKNGSAGEDYIYSATIECLSSFGGWAALASNTVLTPYNPGTLNYVVAQAGNVGIGTTNPVGKLDVVGSLVTARFLSTGSLSLIGTDTTASAQTVLTLSTGVDNATGPNIVLSKSRTQSNGVIVGGDVLGTIQFQGGNGTSSVESSRIQALSADVFSSTSRPSDLLFFTTAVSSTTVTERMRIRANGNVGIGDTGPSSKLQVNGDIRISGAGSAIDGYSGGFLDYASGVFRIRAQETTGGAIAFMTAGNGLSNVSAERMRITSTGNVGIGTNNPITLLHVNHTASHTFIYSTISGASPVAIDNQSGNLAFWTASTRRMDITSTGNVGIGLTNPSAVLQVSRDGGAATIKLLQLDNSNSTYSQNVYLEMNTSKDILWGQGSAGGGTFWNTGTRGYGWSINGTRIVTYDVNGNVGVGTSSPAYKLDVNGTLGVSGAVRFSGTSFRVSPYEFLGSTLLSSTLDSTNNTSYINIGTFSDGFTHIVVEIELVPWLLNTSNIGSYSKTYVIRMTSAQPGVVSTYSANVTKDLGFVGDKYQIGTPIADANNLLQIPVKYIGSGTGNGILCNVRVTGWASGNIDKVSISSTTPAAVSAGTQEYTSFRNKISVGTTSPNASAVLQVDSTTGGFLAPRMTAAQRGAITSPAVGLVVYQTDGTEGLWLYTSANGWKALAIVT